jgi:hypothetical protein
MAIVKCGNGHYYDNFKSRRCPHCESRIDAEQTVNQMHEQHFISEKTLSRRFDPVTGWIICINGKERGRDYRIYSGANSVGRSIKMSIQIPDDDSLSNVDHCKIIYDTKSNSFYLTPSSGNLIYLNEESITQTVQLKKDDHIKIGKSDFMFMPYCEGSRKWD